MNRAADIEPIAPLHTPSGAVRVTAAQHPQRKAATYAHTHTHTHTHTLQVQGLEKGVSENEAPGPVGAYTTTHNDTITLMPNLIHRISFTESHSQN